MELFTIQLLNGLSIATILILISLGLAVIFGIQGAMKANKGESYRYPFNWRLIK